MTRFGLSNLILMDFDVVSKTNINRQLHALQSSVGIKKTVVMKERLLAINPDAEIELMDCFLNQATLDDLMAFHPDAIIDAIDTITAKALLIQTAQQKQIPIISVMGMGNRFDPTQIEIRKLSRTIEDPLARVLRELQRSMKFKDIDVVYSREIPKKQSTIIHVNGMTRKSQQPPGSTPFVPNAAGLAAASYCVRQLLGREDHHE